MLRGREGVGAGQRADDPALWGGSRERELGSAPADTSAPACTPDLPHRKSRHSQVLTSSHTCSHWRAGRRNSCSAFRMPPLQEGEGEGRGRRGVRIGDWIRGRGPEALSSLWVWPTWQGPSYPVGTGYRPSCSGAA